MARAHSIWLATQGRLRIPVAAFTVKHEAVTWLQKHGGANLNIYKLPDGGQGKAEGIAYTELVLD